MENKMGMFTYHNDVKVTRIVTGGVVSFHYVPPNITLVEGCSYEHFTKFPFVVTVEGNNVL